MAAILVPVFLWFTLLGSAKAEDQTDCFDLKIVATPTTQIPSEPWREDPQTIFIRWPWFVDLRVTEIVDGQVRERDIETLAILHSDLPRRPSTFLLRHNDQGSFNMLDPADPDVLVRCSKDAKPMSAYLHPENGMTLRDLRRDLEQHKQDGGNDEEEK